MLYDPDRHEPLHPADADGWDEARARACIAAIVRDTEAQFSPQRGWPTHPLDAAPGTTFRPATRRCTSAPAACCGRCTTCARRARPSCSASGPSMPPGSCRAPASG